MTTAYNFLIAQQSPYAVTSLFASPSGVSAGPGARYLQPDLVTLARMGVLPATLCSRLESQGMVGGRTSAELLMSAGTGSYGFLRTPLPECSGVERPEVPDEPHVELESMELWTKFHNLCTEMVITKSGRYGVAGCVLTR